MPGVVGDARVLTLAPMDPLALDRITPIVMKNVFRYVPGAPPAPAVVVIKDPPPPPADPYPDWRLAELAVGRHGVEAWVQNTRTSEWRTLAVGQSVLGARLLDAQPDQERAIFEIDGALYEFFTNATLDARNEIPQGDDSN